MIELMEHQLDAIEQLDNGKILYGETGTGKSVAALGYYVKKEAPKDVYVITTAKKRDSSDWQIEAASFGLGPDRSTSTVGVISVDSWNNIGKYTEVADSFFIFDEQRLVGRGEWVKAFYKIAKKNHWILLSATPGDTWSDYAPVFIANGFYRNITQFNQMHVVYKSFMSFPVIEGYVNVRRLELLRNELLVEMPYLREEKQKLNYLEVGYDRDAIRAIKRDRWHPFEDRPIVDAAEMWRVMRRVTNSDPSRIDTLRWLMTIHPKIIVFYNFNYELDILRTLAAEVPLAEWNGHKHEAIPATDEWVYLVQYISGAEGWNCTATDAMCLYSLSYSYKNFVQARGRIDRLDSPFDRLFYYIFVSHSVTDLAIRQSLDQKRSFNQKNYLESKAFREWDKSDIGV